MKIRLVGAELFHAYRRRDRQTWPNSQSLLGILRTCLKQYLTCC